MSVYFTVTELTKLLKVNEGKILGWINSCQLEAFNVGEGQKKPRYRVSQAALDKFIQSRTKTKPPSLPRRKKHNQPRVWIQ